MSQRKIPRPGEFYRHFKNKLYQIVAVAIHSETHEELVIYQALYGDYKIYARPLEMFLSPVDKVKYPEASQVYRFEKVDMEAEYKKEASDANRTVTQTEVHSTVSLAQDNEKADEAASQQVLEDIQSEEEYKMDADVERFLDARTVKEKVDILMSLRDKVTKKQLHDMAIVMDITIDDTTIDDMFLNLLTCLRTLARFEIER